jgi:histidine triad (HIT) family protein
LPWRTEKGVSREPNCIFCKIVAAEIPAAVVYEDDAILAFLDVGPLADGHLLVIPREHYAKLTDVPPARCAQVASALPFLGRAVLQVTRAEGFNVLLNEGRVAGQAVAHVHFHIIPRKTDDQLGYRWNAGKYAEGRAAELASAYQRAMAEHAP